VLSRAGPTDRSQASVTNSSRRIDEHHPHSYSVNQDPPTPPIGRLVPARRERAPRSAPARACSGRLASASIGIWVTPARAKRSASARSVVSPMRWGVPPGDTHRSSGGYETMPAALLNGGSASTSQRLRPTRPVSCTRNVHRIIAACAWAVHGVCKTFAYPSKTLYQSQIKPGAPIEIQFTLRGWLGASEARSGAVPVRTLGAIGIGSNELGVSTAARASAYGSAA
jgi:hypothetical protein